MTILIRGTVFDDSSLPVPLEAPPEAPIAEAVVTFDALEPSATAAELLLGVF